jgi:hypothetical protein
VTNFACQKSNFCIASIHAMCGLRIGMRMFRELAQIKKTEFIIYLRVGHESQDSPVGTRNTDRCRHSGSHGLAAGFLIFKVQYKLGMVITTPQGMKPHSNFVVYFLTNW